MKIALPLFSKVVIIKVGNSPVPATGITNVAYTKKRKPLEFYATFLDYDDVAIQHVRKDVKALQLLYDLGTGFVWRTDKSSFHVAFPSLTNWVEQVMVLHSANVDKAYKHEFVRYGERTLRVSGKGPKPAPVFKEILRASTNRPVSLAHVHYCMHSSGVANGVLEQFNGGMWQTRLQIVKYHTSKY